MFDEFPPLDEPEISSGGNAPMRPHSRDAEEAVLGAVLFDKEMYYSLSMILKADDFYIDRNRWVWESFDRLQEQRIDIDILTVKEDMKNAGKLEELGGEGYLAKLLNNVPSTLHSEAYGQIVERTSVRRRMLDAANEIAKLAYQEDMAVDTAMDEAERAVFGISERRLTSGPEKIKNVLTAFYDRLNKLAQRDEEILGVPTGFTDLDRLLGGLQPSDLLIVAGRPGQGKTALMLTIAKNAARLHKKHVAVFSLEMSNEQLVQRLVSQEAMIDAQLLRTGKLSDKQWDLLAESMTVLGNTTIFLDDTPGLTPLQLRTKCRRLHLEHRLDLIVIDYLQLMGSGLRSENRVQEVSHISRNLKILAKELNVPVLAAAQLSRAVEQRAEKRPILSDLRESGSLEQDADIVMFIYRPDQYEDDTDKENIAEIMVAKHRNGPTGSVDLIFRGQFAKYENAVTKTFNTRDMR